MMKRIAVFLSFLVLTAADVVSQESDLARLFGAVGKGDLDAVKSLIARNASLLDAKTENGLSMLHVAAWGGHPELMRYLIESGADIDIEDPEGVTPLNIAAECGHEAVVKLLIEKEADVDHRNDYGRTPLIGAARERGNVKVVRMLLDAGADVNAADRFGDTALFLATWRGFGDVIDLLLEKGARLPTQARKIRAGLVETAKKGLNKMFFRLVEEESDLSFAVENGGTLLHAAASGGAVPILEALTARRLDVNGRDENGWTPLHFAAEMGRKDAVGFLLERGAATGARTIMGQTAYNIANENGNPEVVRVLADKGADQSPPQFPVLTGEYLGQKKPGNEPEVFGKGIVTSRYRLHGNVVFSPDGNEALWTNMVPPRGQGYSSGATMRSRLVGGRWSYPECAVCGAVPLEDACFFHPAGSKLYDIARRSTTSGTTSDKENIWVWERVNGEWINPRPLPAAVNNYPVHWQFGVDREENVYLSLNLPGSLGEADIYVCRQVDGQYEKAVNLGPAINTDATEEAPFIAADGSYLLFVRDRDIYVSFKDAGGKWMKAEPLGSDVNTSAFESLPQVSPDGKYFFFMRDWESWWVDARIIEEFKPKS